MFPRIQKAQFGFTLIELLVAISILAIVAIMGWRGLDSIVRARLILNEELTQSRGSQLIFAQLENDCAHIASEVILPKREILRTLPQQIFLIRSVDEENRAPSLQVVAYRLHEGVIYRRASSATRSLVELQTMWDSAMAGSDNFPQVALANKVQSLELRTWDRSENTWRVSTGDAPIYSAGQKSGTVLTVDGNDTPLKTGLEVSMQVQGMEFPLLKIFLLGAA
jgi:general secretion pathway protein J